MIHEGLPITSPKCSVIQNLCFVCFAWFSTQYPKTKSNCVKILICGLDITVSH